MSLGLVENMTLNSLIPSGKRLYFHCSRCGKVIKVRSLWRNLLAIPGCFLFLILVVLFRYSPSWPVGIVAAILAIYPLTLVFEIATRVRYPSVETQDDVIVDQD
jgi:hypothetical protein